MTAPVLTFFNNKGGVGKTSLVYHLSWMLAAMGKNVVVLDLDPQANLTAAFLDEDQIARLWEEPADATTIFGDRLCLFIRFEGSPVDQNDVRADDVGKCTALGGSNSLASARCDLVLHLAEDKDFVRRGLDS